MALRAGDRDRRDQRGAADEAVGHPAADLGLARASRSRCRFAAASRILILGPTRPEKIQGVYRLGFALKGKGLPPAAAFWQAVKLTGRRVAGHRQLADAHRAQAGPRADLEPGRDRRGVSAAVDEGADTTSGCSG